MSGLVLTRTVGQSVVLSIETDGETTVLAVVTVESARRGTASLRTVAASAVKISRYDERFCLDDEEGQESSE
ncbi:MAG: hypothetical protein EBR82_16885 [Caulobacteraceae bacterium]|nr:hypothetical protein [Caulobacteraceae bacterium]